MNARRPQLDLLSPAAVVGLVLEAEQRVVPAVRERTAEIARAATLVAERFAADGRLAFVGAGTSGRIAMAEAAELPGTFGLPRHRVLACVAGGVISTDRAEDDLDLAAADAHALTLTERDVVVAVAASGSTPYTLALARAAKEAGSAVVTVTAARPSPLAELADVAIEVCIAQEVVRGSSRLTAGTAQKIVLNAITTTAMALLGRVHGDLMIDVEPANGKLRRRLADIVADITECTPGEAAAALERCGDNGRAAVVHLLGGMPPEQAAKIAGRHARLRDALRAAQVAANDVGDADG